jgi:NAD(P)-dependent dehydrogenase (short-subunit alcohol dehydrogenase family)
MSDDQWGAVSQWDTGANSRSLGYGAVVSGVSKAVLVTGCSTGIGRATAERLARRGWTVFASARRLESIKDLADAGCTLVTLDVADEESRRAAVGLVEATEGALGALVNNAGYGLSGPVEEVPLDEWRRQFETNLFGMVRLTQLALPGMRRQRWGRIVNVSSIGGRLTFPGGGPYHASKHAVEAMSDALRYEVKPFGVRVSVIEPGIIRTKFADTAVSSATEHGADGPYAEFSAGAELCVRSVGASQECCPRDRTRDPTSTATPALPGHRRRPHDPGHAGADDGPGLGPHDAHRVPAAQARRHQPERLTSPTPKGAT